MAAGAGGRVSWSKVTVMIGEERLGARFLDEARPSNLRAVPSVTAFP